MNEGRRKWLLTRFPAALAVLMIVFSVRLSEKLLIPPMHTTCTAYLLKTTEGWRLTTDADADAGGEVSLDWSEQFYGCGAVAGVGVPTREDLTTTQAWHLDDGVEISETERNRLVLTFLRTDNAMGPYWSAFADGLSHRHRNPIMWVIAGLYLTWYVSVPLLLLSLLSMETRARRKRRRKKRLERGECPECAYPYPTPQSARCPECGMERAATPLS